ncbi:excinuclease ABC subunit UvrB [Ancylomarina sp. 16SWW S1-10-2]|uniref:excinuclease ABC subunit UvrB n=1 Tax=Ancylomarina sp. 16SWW S1-10-2 TaxID=2499681 RepID=UPI0012AD65ED|nr:excinuclease ABC subunit UvrB [Ancylomarina sp. 16SWW S1-10-2]MRT93271.1 excinuclease ABC subunit UvrB [Ancylomarina sp. 16SWW S1-10-2]
MDFKIVSKFKPTGDQPEAIKQLTEGLNNGNPFQTLLGVTGSGKTFTIANVINEVQRPTLVLSHNKTLAAQLYGEFKNFFPDNAVEYFVSYYDYYQPEAYLPTTNTYIEKDLAINDEIEKLRLRATSALLSGRKDVIIVSSVSCIYGIGNPEDFHANVLELVQGQRISRNKLLLSFVDALYSRNEVEFERGNFRVKGDTIDIFPAYADFAYRITFWDDEIDEIYSFDPLNGHKIERYDRITIYPANLFITSKDKVQNAIKMIQDDMVAHVDYMKSIGKHLEAKRVEDKVTFDLEMIRELGYCSGIENYSRYFDGRAQGSRPFCLIDYFPDDILMVIDESHVTLSQVKAMYGGDHSRKVNLVDYGFRLPSALDNRPLKFEEFEALSSQTIYVSATPTDYELEKSEGVVVEQIIRPTGLLDPQIDVRPSLNQIDDLVAEIHKRSEIDERVLVTTLTKRMAEELSQYFADLNIRCRYIHSDVDTLDRVKIMEDLRLGLFDVLIGVNLLREGLDLPEVSLVAILDADKEGFLRSTRALVQTSGRAARNINGLVIMYADRITKSMKETIDSTNYRREKQLAYNSKHNITPTQIIKDKTSIMQNGSSSSPNAYSGPETVEIAADPVVQYMSKEGLEKSIAKTKKSMQKSAKELDFLQAAQFRDEMYKLEKLLKEKS